MFSSLDHFLAGTLARWHHEAARPQSRLSSQMEELRATMRQVQVWTWLVEFVVSLRNSRNIKTYQGKEYVRIYWKVIHSNLSRCHAFWASTFSSGRIPPSHQRREEDSERSSDEARQCEAEAALELSKVAALLLGRSWADGRANRMEWNGIGCGFFWESFWQSCRYLNHGGYWWLVLQ